MYRKFDIRDYQIKRDDDYIFDKSGNLVKVIRKAGPHRLGMPDKKGVMRYYQFADQVNDPKNIEANPNGAKLIPYSRNDVFNTIGMQGGFEDKNVNLMDFYYNSKGGSRFDYSAKRLIPDHISWRNKRGEPLHPDSTFFVPEGDGYAHNTFNFGNFLWGATGSLKGYNDKILRLGAHANNLLNPDKNGYERGLDSPDDQFSISQGTKYAEKNRDWARKEYGIEDYWKNRFKLYKNITTKNK